MGTNNSTYYRNVLDNLNNWLIPMFDDNFEIIHNKNEISTLSVRKENFWNIINNSSFLTNEEKKKILEVN